ncbi:MULTISPECIES: hypothetical protein [Bacillus amyloliquefaciens group]|uniref:hypothetical protein n=1 Tax=Bacillus amyloliquefaciens group TaxID=1938374 RepID=UPI00073C9F44|nr:MULTISPECIES: hypothetical protein [Bacillus amyloliquefaciens group]KTF59774.1 hypothetical protein AR691_13655 [Bacillus amyloliquefaciens]
MKELNAEKIGYVKKFIVANNRGDYLKENGLVKLFNTKTEANNVINKLNPAGWVVQPVNSEVVKVGKQDPKNPEKVYGYSISLGDRYLTSEDGGVIVLWTLSEALRSMEVAVNKVRSTKKSLPLDPPNMVLVTVDKVDLMGDIKP